MTTPQSGFRSLRSGFERNAAERPDATALVVRGRSLSFGALDDTARRWAGAVSERIGRRPERIGVFGSRSEVSYTGALAALYAGAGFVPLNPRFPPDRTRAMVRQAGLDAVFVDQLGSAQLAAVLEGLDNLPPVWLPETEHAAALSGAQRLEQLPELRPDSLAYLLFTSGTTGTPKGVPIVQSNVRAFIDWAADRYDIRPEDRFSQTFDQTFDLSVFDLFVAWERGASVYAMSPVDLLAPTKFINTNQLTVWFSVPSVPAQMRKRGSLKPGALPTLRWSLFCGEPLPRASAEAWLAAAPNSIVENLYGPTELTIACTVFRWTPEAAGMCVNEMVPIGRPYPGLAAVLVDDSLQPVPEGEAGEFCLCGPQTSPGYWHNPEKTAERFVRIPASGRDDIFYRTGDLARRLDTGDYVCLGRTDHQIKVLGFRVELGEIEGVLQNVPGVVQAVAMGWPVVEGTAQGIVAIVSGAGVAGAAVKDACAQTLSDYMVPRAVYHVDEMPLNANGKMDRGELAKRLERGELRAI